MSNEQAKPAAVVILAAGQGTRMKSSKPKVLHEVAGRSLLGHAMAAAEAVNPERLCVVVRHGRDEVAEAALDIMPTALIADQDDIPGTGRAAQCALKTLDADGAIAGAVLVTGSDVPLLDGGTFAQLLATHAADGNAITMLTTILDDPTGYGRVLRGADGSVEGIVEHRDASEAQRAVKEINAGVYVFDAATLRDGLASLGTDNDQGEMYLTDVIAYARKQGNRVGAVITDDPWTVEGANDRAQLADLGKEFNRRIVKQAMLDGVTVIDPATTWIDVTVALEADATIKPGTQLHGTTVISAGATVGPDTTLTDTYVGPGADVNRVVALNARIGEKATVGPFTYLRPGTVLGTKAKAGGFVEAKNVTIGDGAKVPHLSYVGDAEIGEGANLGAGTIIANYDGVNKHRSIIGKQVRVGSNNVLVAPVDIGDGAYTAAGSVITDDVAPGALGIGRAREVQIDGWVLTNREGTGSAEAATAAGAKPKDDDSLLAD